MNYQSPNSLLKMPKSRASTDPGKFIQRGLPVRCLKAFQAITKATEEELLNILWISPKSMKSRVRIGRLRPAESDRLYCATRIISNAFLQFDGNEEKVRTWLRKPAKKNHPVLPITLLGTYGGVELADYYLRGTYFETYLLEKTNSSEAGKKDQEKYPDPLSILGLRRTYNIDGQIRRGFSFRSYELFRKRTLLSVKEMQEILWYSPAAISRWRAAGRLPADASNRLYRTAVILYFANILFDSDPDDVYDWIHDEVPALGYRRPIDLLTTDPDAELVLATTCRLLDGIAT